MKERIIVRSEPGWKFMIYDEDPKHTNMLPILTWEPKPTGDDEVELWIVTPEGSWNLWCLGGEAIISPQRRVYTEEDDNDGPLWFDSVDDWRSYMHNPARWREAKRDAKIIAMHHDAA